MSRVGAYEIVRELARGANGIVYLARGPQGSEVAVKRMLPGAEPQDLLRFEREARAGLALRHPHVVATLAVGRSDSGELRGPFVACELCSGGSLQERIERSAAFPEAQALAIIVDVLRGLEAIHAAGLVHRDVKPANVLFDGAGRAKLADLGLARRTALQRTQLTLEGAILGTPAYIAPEQVEHGERVDARADLYSTGVMLHQLIAGRLPFEGRDVLDFLRAHVAQAPPPLAATPRIARLVRELLAKRPEERPASATAVLARIAEAHASSPPVPACTPSADELRIAATLDDPGPTLPDSGAEAATLARTLDASPAGAFELASDDGSILFVFAAQELTLGRDGGASDARHVCLRVLPHAANSAASLHISGRHLTLRRGGERWFVRDTSSRGTTLDGQRLAPGVETALHDGAELDLAGVLALRARFVPPAAASAGLPASLVLERPRNGTHQRYLFVAAPLALDLTSSPPRLGCGEALLAARDGAPAWLHASAHSTLELHPRLQVRPLRAEDFKL